MTRKGEIIQALIEAARFRKQMRYAVAKKRFDLAFQAADNIFAMHEKILRAFLKNAPPRRRRIRAKTQEAELDLSNVPRTQQQQVEKPEKQLSERRSRIEKDAQFTLYRIILHEISF